MSYAHKAALARLELVWQGPLGTVTGQFADTPTHSQSGHGLVNLRTSQLAKTSHLKFAINCSNYDLR